MFVYVIKNADYDYIGYDEKSDRFFNTEKIKTKINHDLNYIVEATNNLLIFATLKMANEVMREFVDRDNMYVEKYYLAGDAKNGKEILQKSSVFMFKQMARNM